jgi:hypothetical protein
MSAMWLFDFPHHSISTLIGQHFPWPVARSLKWPALLAERTLIEAVICIPAALVLALCWRRAAVFIAAVLCAIFCARVAFDFPQAPPGSGVWSFLFAIAGIHTALLMGATAYFAYRVRRSGAESFGFLPSQADR